MRVGIVRMLSVLVVSFVLLGGIAAGSAPAPVVHIIAGGVFDSNRNPLPDIDVELMDDLGRMIQRSKTGGGGRFEFQVGTQKRYTVKVFAFRYDFEDQSQDVDVASVSAQAGEGGSSYNNVDFYLQPKRGGLMDAELSVVFAQDIPAEAKKAYEGAVKDLGTKRRADGFAGLNKAIELKPDYYMALNRMGKELFAQGRFEEAVPFLLKSAEINTKSPTSYYYLGASLIELGKEYHKAAVASLTRAAELAPNAAQVHFALGKAQRTIGETAAAEKSLVKAKKLAASNIPAIHRELAQLYSDDLKKYDQAADELESYMKAAGQKGTEQEKTKKVIANLRAKAKGN